MPDNDRDLMIQAKEYYLLNYDNASSMKPELSDTLCSLATGGGVAVRKLYTDGELHVMSFTRPIVINGISGYANRPDLLERGIPLRLQPMPVGGRKAESELLEEFRRLQPAILASLFDAIAGALRRYPTTVDHQGVRMADAARWISAAEADLGLSGPPLVESIIEAQRAMIIDRANGDPLIILVRRWLATKPDGKWDGHMAQLHDELTKQDELHRVVPRSPSGLSALLERLRPAMVAAEIEVVLGRDNRGRTIRLRATPEISSRPGSAGGVDGPGSSAGPY
jgi:hypothetical protein